MQLEESSVLVCGGSSGIGLASAKALVQSGVTRIMLASRSSEQGHKAVASISSIRGNVDVVWHPLDATSPASATDCADACARRFGRIDVLVNTIGNFYMPTLLHEIPIEEMQTMVATIAAGAMLPCRAVLPHMMKQMNGSIICVASDAAKIATPGESVIGAGMAAIVMFCRGLALEAKRSGIRANVLTPSIVRGTPLYDRVMNEELSKKLFSKAESMANLGVVDAEDLARMIVFLSGPDSRRMTGQAISITGGISVI